MEELNIGAKVQEFRKKSGMSLRDLAAQTELSPSMLSQIENNSANPSINTLKNIAAALRVPLFKFFKEEPESGNLIVRRGTYKILGQSGQDVLYKLLTPDTSGSIEFCLMDIPAGASSSEAARNHDGEEVAYVISGETDIVVGSASYHLEAGDAIKIPAMSLHRWINTSQDGVQVIFAVTPPNF